MTRKDIIQLRKLYINTAVEPKNKFWVFAHPGTKLQQQHGGATGSGRLNMPNFTLLPCFSTHTINIYNIRIGSQRQKLMNVYNIKIGSQ